MASGVEAVVAQGAGGVDMEPVQAPGQPEDLPGYEDGPAGRPLFQAEGSADAAVVGRHQVHDRDVDLMIQEPSGH